MHTILMKEFPMIPEFSVGGGGGYMGCLPGRIRGRILKMLGTRNFRWLARQEK